MPVGPASFVAIFYGRTRRHDSAGSSRSEQRREGGRPGLWLREGGKAEVRDVVGQWQRGVDTRQPASSIARKLVAPLLHAVAAAAAAAARPHVPSICCSAAAVAGIGARLRGEDCRIPWAALGLLAWDSGRAGCGTHATEPRSVTFLLEDEESGQREGGCWRS